MMKSAKPAISAVNFFLLPSVFFLVILLAQLCHAQTEIEGEVSGVWTAEDSPYIVTDSTWVPEDDTLRIDAGVTVLFEEGVALNVFGTIGAFGTEEDTVIFQGSEDSTAWHGIRLYRDNRIQRFSYCTIMTNGDAILLDDNSRLEMINCKTMAGGSPVLDVSERGNTEGVRIVLDDSYIEGRDWIGGFNYSRISATGSYIKTKGIAGSYLTISLENCTFFGECGSPGDVTNYTNSQFLALNDSSEVEVYVTQNIINCLVNGRLRVFNLRNNGVTGSVDSCIVNGWVSTDGEYVRINNSEIHLRMSVDCDKSVITNTLSFGFTTIDSDDSLIIQNSEFRDVATINASHILIDSSIFLNTLDVTTYENTIIKNSEINRYHPNSGLQVTTWTDEQCSIRISRNIIRGKLDVSRISEVEIFNNTVLILEQSEITRSSIDISCENGTLNFYNNILYDSTDSWSAFRIRDYEDDDITINYNCIYGFEDRFDGLFDRYYPNFVLDTTNILVDPGFVSYNPVNPQLSINSPCIDAGDPASPNDLDDTRADIGALYFPQSNNFINPFLESRNSLVEVNIYPNPCNSMLNFELNETIPFNLTIYDLEGRKLMSETYESRELSLRLNENFSSGLYIIEIGNRKNRLLRTISIVK